MKNDRFREIFPKPHTFLPVVHTETLKQTLHNIGIALENGADGAFLIHHKMDSLALLSFYKKAREEFPHFWLGLNLLGMMPTDALRSVLQETGLDGLWTDNVRVFETGSTPEARKFSELQKELRWKGLYFGGTAFKYQQPVTDLKRLTGLASQFTDVVTTSGTGTGERPTVEKIRDMKHALNLHGAGVEGATPYLAIASGMTPENVHEYMPYADCFLVASGISSSFTELDPKRVRAFANALKQGV